MNETIVLPTPERYRRGVELVPKAISDEDGRPSQPHRNIDTLMVMERNGSITPSMRQAGEDFRIAFRRAHIGDICASDPSRPFVSGIAFGRQFGGNPKARESVYEALELLGGPGAPAGSIAWHVLGLEWLIKQWAMMYSAARHRHVSEKSASGILIGALCPLTVFYGYEKSG